MGKRIEHAKEFVHIMGISTGPTLIIGIVVVITHMPSCNRPEAMGKPGVVPPRPDASIQVAEIHESGAPEPSWQEIGSFRTKYKCMGKHVGRATNIATAAGRLNRDIEPGGILSFNSAVGVRSVRNGFVQAPVILMGRIVQDVGGGTCQAASTMHAAARMSGMHVKERRPHSRLSDYIDPGLDATVSFPIVCMKDPKGRRCELIDLKIQNPYLHPIRMRTDIFGSGEDRILHVIFEGKFTPMARASYMFRKGSVSDKPERKWHRTGKRMSPTYRRLVQSSRPGWFVTSKVTFHPLLGDAQHEMRWHSRYLAVDEVWEVGARWDRDGGAPWER